MSGESQPLTAGDIDTQSDLSGLDDETPLASEARNHVALAQLWGAMPALPRALPRFTRDLRQRWDDVGRPKLPSPPADAHDALADARHNLARWKVIEEHRRKIGFPVR